MDEVLNMKNFPTVVFLLLLSLNIHAATIVVTNTSNTGIGSLREQITGANDGDTIRFSPTLLTTGSNSIVLTSKFNYCWSIQQYRHTLYLWRK